MRVRKFGIIPMLLSLFAIITTGCMYPNERKMENQLPIDQQVASVQEAIDRYHAENGVLPILTKEANTPVYEKYVIDFSKLMPKYIPYIPGGAFEQGGIYVFVLTDVEVKPTVRLLDLKMVEQIGDIQARVSYYFEKNKSLPVAGVVKPGYFQIKLGDIGVSKDKATIESPITGNRLPVIMTSQGVVGVDYLTDLEKIMKSNSIKYDPKKDIRDIIPENSLYVPVKSFPYGMEKGKLTLVSENK